MDILRREYNNLVKERFIDSEFIKDVVYEWLRDNELNDYVKYIRFRNIDGALAGYYDSEDKTVYVDFDRTLRKCSKRIVPFKRRIFELYTEEEVMAIYNHFFNLLMHECGHGYQELLISNYVDMAHEVFLISEALAFNHFNVYREEHDLFPHEHYADLFGYISSDDIMCSLDENYNSKLLRIIRHYLTKDYEQVRYDYLSPFEKVLTLCGDVNMKRYIDNYSMEKDMDPFIRLGLGVNASRENIITARSLNESNIQDVKQKILFK